MGTSGCRQNSAVLREQRCREQCSYDWWTWEDCVAEEGELRWKLLTREGKRREKSCGRLQGVGRCVVEVQGKARRAQRVFKALGDVWGGICSKKLGLGQPHVGISG